MSALHPSGLARPPRYATARNPALASRGKQVEAIARALARPLKPHQQYIADVATELNPPGSHFLFRYQVVIILLPRQSGKTTLMRPILTDRCITRPRTSVVMSAQLGKDSSDRWEDLVVDVEDGPLGRFVKILRGKGAQVLTWLNRSKIEPFTPTKKGVHGKSPNVGLIDEAWAFSKEDMGDVMVALNPAMITKRDRQLYIISAAGDATSTYLNELIDECRKDLDEGAYTTTAFFEWSPPEGADPYDEATWEFHPGLDGLITIEDLREEAKPTKNSHAAFLRSYMNITTRQREHTVIELDTFDALLTEATALPDADAVSFAYDVAIDRTAASVWAAWRDDAGIMQLRVGHTDEGADWLAGYLRAALDAGDIVHLAADDGGPARVVTDQLVRAGHTVQTLAGRDFATAWTSLKGEMTAATPTVAHDGSTALRAAVEVAAEKRMGDSTALSRSMSLGPIDPLLAATVAAWYADRLPSAVPIY